MLACHVVLWLLGNKHRNVTSDTFLVQLIKLQFFNILVPYYNCVWTFCLIEACLIL